MRILTRLWPEDSSTSVSIEWQNQRREGGPTARPPTQKSKQKETNTQKKTTDTDPTNTNQQRRGEGASVEKPGTSLARQFKHLDTKQDKPRTPEPTN